MPKNKPIEIFEKQKKSEKRKDIQDRRKEISYKYIRFYFMRIKPHQKDVKCDKNRCSP